MATLKSLCLIFLSLSVASLVMAGDNVKELGYIFNSNNKLTNVYLKVNSPEFGPLCVELTSNEGIDFALDKNGDLVNKDVITNLLLQRYKLLVSDLQVQAANMEIKKTEDAIAASKITISITNQDLATAVTPK